MGSKQALSNGREPEELTDLLQAFETANTCSIILSASLALHRGKLDVCWQATAVGGSTGLLVASVLDSQNVKVWGGDYRTLLGVATQLLYALDFQLASREFERVLENKA
jgi:hypothetical protein